VSHPAKTAVAIEEVQPVVVWDGVAVDHAAVWVARGSGKGGLACTAGVAVVGRSRHCELRCVVELTGHCGDHTVRRGASVKDINTRLDVM
jgi:hypothetical protein